MPQLPLYCYLLLAILTLTIAADAIFEWCRCSKQKRDDSRGDRAVLDYSGGRRDF
jgi:hypothetical protein